MNNDKKPGNKKIGSIAKIGAELFSKKGFAETSMDDIASAAKLSKGGIYHYFSSKTELLNFILDNFMDVVLTGLQNELRGVDNVLEKVRRLIFHHVSLYPKRIAEAKTLFHEVQNLPPKYSKTIVAKEREYYRIMANVLTDYFGSTLDKHQITAITFILLGMCNSIYAWYNPKSPLSPEQLSQTIFDILTDGICSLQKSRK